MQRFVDNAGRTWVIQINVAAVKRVRGLLDVDLYKLVDNGFAGLAELLADPITLVDVIYVLCKDQADKEGVSDESFGASMAGDSIMLATEAFLDELTDFFPDPRIREGLKKVIAASRKMRDHIMERAFAKIKEIDPIREAERLIASSGTAPGSSESTPDLLPFEN